jgi:hypothetical protein
VIKVTLVRSGRYVLSFLSERLLQGVCLMHELFVAVAFFTLVACPAIAAMLPQSVKVEEEA